ncbi:MAG: hypothetical protein ACW9XH_03905 [Candidatus Nitrosopumilus sp. bin_32a]
MSFKIKYKFKNDKKYHICILTYEQYKNFKILPIVNECDIIKKTQKNTEAYKKEMQKALNLASQESLKSHIRKLSENA